MNDDSQGDSGAIAGGWTLNVTTLLTGNSDVKLSITNAPDPVVVGSSLTYTVVVTNSGPASVQPVVTVELPGTVAFVSAVSTQGAVSQADGFLTANLGVMAWGQTAKITAVVIPASPGAISCFASLSGVAGDPRPENDSGRVYATVLELPSISIRNASVVEGNTGTRTALFTVTLSSVFPQPVSVQWATADGTATAGSDYISASGQLTFPSGSTTQQIAVGVKPDTLNEADETFTVILSNPLGAGLSNQQGVGTILNDDPIPSLSAQNVAVAEGDSGTVNAVFTVRLSGPSGQTVTVDYATADGTASAPSDYQSGSGKVSFLPGETQKSVSVSVNGDTTVEADESFQLLLTNPVNASVSGFGATCTILNDDILRYLSVQDVSVLEGDSGTRNALFTVRLSSPASQPVTVDYTTSDGTALSPLDYIAASGAVTFLAGETQKQVAIQVVGDVSNEPDESFQLTLSNPTNALLSTTVATCTVQNDDPLPNVTVQDVNVTEGDAGTAAAVFTISISPPSGRAVTVDYRTLDQTATSPADYTALGLATLTFAPGESTKTVSVLVRGDTVNEADETFQLLLSNPVNATLVRSAAVGIIKNDDPLPSLAINDALVSEGAAGTTPALFTVTLSPASGQTVTVDYSSADLTATAANDYVALSPTTLTFAPGETAKTVSVLVNGDRTSEADETFQVTLRNAQNATISRSQGLGTITNDDPLPILSIDDVTVAEGNSGSVNAVFTVTLSAASGQTVKVGAATVDGAAVAGADYIAASGTLTFPAGSTIQTFTVAVRGDALNEADENFSVVLSGPVNAVLGKSQGQVTILDDDMIPALSINGVTVNEGNSGAVNAAFAVSLSAASGQTVSVHYATADGSAIAGADYTAASGTVTFPPGSTNQTITVAVLGDTVPEPAETFLVNLDSPVHATLANTQAAATILDDETRTLTFGNASPITIPLSGAATPYPSNIQITGLPGQLSKVAVTLVGLSHTFPDDLDLLLVGPSGQSVVLMSDAGGGSAVSGINLILDDTASVALPDSGPLTSGAYRPGDYPLGDVWPWPAPSAASGTRLATLNGTQPNGTWSLYVVDDTSGDMGAIGQGWNLSLTTTNLVCCSSGSAADLSITLTDSADPAVVGSSFRYQAVVINSGPGPATGAAASLTLPVEMSFGSATPSQGSFSRSGSVVTWTIGSLGVGAVATLIVNVTPSVDGTFTCPASVSGVQADSVFDNNSAMASTRVELAPPTLSINDSFVTEPNVTTAPVDFTVTLSRAIAQPVTVGFSTSGGSATSGIDYIANTGVLTFPPGSTAQTITVLANGDTAVEANETFSVVLSNPVNATIARGTGAGTILNDDGLSGRVDHFRWDAVASPQSGGLPFNVKLTALDAVNAAVSDFNGAIDLTGMVGSGASPSVIVSELDATRNRTEFVNVSSFNVDVSGWQITIYDRSSWPSPRLNYVIPAGTISPPGSVFVLNTGGSYPGAYPGFYSGVDAFWINDDIDNQIAVLLRTQTGQFVDFICAVDGYASTITDPAPIPSSQWQGSPVPAVMDSALSYQRTGGVDQNSSSGWVAAPQSIGTLNAGLSIPFAGPKPISIAPSVSGAFAGGVWTGSLTVLQAATNMYVRADDRNGHSGLSGTFSVTPPNQPPTITAIADQVTDEDTPTLSIPFTIGDPDTPLANLVIGKSSSDTALVPVNNIVVGGAGTARTVRITPATNAFGSATITLSVTDGTSTNTRAFLLTVNSINDPPVFAKGTDKAVLEDAGPQTVAGWATGISPGPANEASQTVAFLVAADLPGLFAAQPAVDPSGKLSFTAAPNAVGVATISVRLRDSGGTASGGVDTSWSADVYDLDCAGQ